MNFLQNREEGFHILSSEATLILPLISSLATKETDLYSTVALLALKLLSSAFLEPNVHQTHHKIAFLIS